MRKWIGVAALLLATGGVIARPAVAQPTCWTPRELSAAQVRDLQTILMVAALQCRASGDQVLPNYNRMVSAARDRIAGHNDVLKARFNRIAGPRAYDRFTTALANGHSAGAQTPGFCREMAGLAAEAARSAAMPGALEMLAARVSGRPAGVVASCRDPNT